MMAIREDIVWVAALLALPQACGGNLAASVNGAPDAAGVSSPTDAALPEGASRGGTTGPIDASGAPTAFVMTCSGSNSEIAFKLPCAVGMNPINVTECYPLGGDSHARPVLTFMVPLAYMAEHLNEPFRLEDFPAPPGAEPLVAGGLAYARTKTGTLTISQVDPVARAYVGQLQFVEWTATPDDGSTIVCSAENAPIWALPGGFL